MHYCEKWIAVVMIIRISIINVTFLVDNNYVRKFVSNWTLTEQRNYIKLPSINSVAFSIAELMPLMLHPWKKDIRKSEKTASIL